MSLMCSLSPAARFGLLLGMLSISGSSSSSYSSSAVFSTPPTSCSLTDLADESELGLVGDAFGTVSADLPRMSPRRGALATRGRCSLDLRWWRERSTEDLVGKAL